MSSAETVIEPTADREDVITRVYDAPARFLFKAWSESEHLMKWYGPKGWPLTLCEVDFRVGGRYLFGMTGPDGAKMPPFGGEYLDIVPNRKIVFDADSHSPDSSRLLVTVTFDETEGKTTLSVRTLFPTIAMKEMFINSGYAQGYASAFDQLAELIQGMQDKAST